MFGFVAVFKDKHNSHFIESVHGVFDSIFIEEKINWYRNYMKDPRYEQTGLYLTNNKQVFLNLILKAKLLELRGYVAFRRESIGVYKDPDVNRLVEEARDLLERTLIKSVALRTQQCLRNDVDVEDELALSCLVWYQGRAYR